MKFEKVMSYERLTAKPLLTVPQQSWPVLGMALQNLQALTSLDVPNLSFSDA